MIEQRKPKAGDVLVAVVDDRCFSKGREYLVYEDKPGDPSVICNGCRGEPRHYLYYEGWSKQLTPATPVKGAADT